jgi:ubiquitin-conjugating enzyme E2 variant
MVGTAAGGALVTCVALIVLIGGRLGAAIDGPPDQAMVALAVVAGVLACDLAAGVVHWACDRFFNETTPILGRALIAPFREHHDDPLAMTRRGFLAVNSSNWFVMLPVLVYAAACDAAAVFAQAFVLGFATAVLLTNQFHKWAHARTVPLLVRWLQRAHLILPPHVHARHHRGGHTRAYCVTGGWLNPVLDRLDVFARLENAIRACVSVSRAADQSS